MQAAGQEKPSPGIIFDTGMNKACDALALAMLYGLNAKDARLVAVSVSGSNLRAAAFCEVVGEFYAGAVSGAFGGAPRTLPVGLSMDGKLAADAPLFTAPLARRNAEGKPVYRQTIQKLNDTADPVAVIRNAMTSQEDHNAIVIESGPATTLAHLLALHEAHETIVNKTKLLIMAVGIYPEGEELYVQADPAAARKVFAEWPTPIVVCGSEVGDALLFPATSIDKDFAWTQAHPVVDAYRAFHAMPYDAPTQAMAAALYAARPKAGQFELSERGTISVAGDGRTKFTPAADGKHRYLIPGALQKPNIIEAYIQLASAKPAPPPRRPRPQP